MQPDSVVDLAEGLAIPASTKTHTIMVNYARAASGLIAANPLPQDTQE
jgi:hypothetical protein